VNETDILPNDKAPTTELERGTGIRALGKAATEKGNPSRFFVRVTSFRRRLLDEDNICEKYIVDCCRYAGIIPSDAPAQTSISSCQTKVGKKEDERTLVEVWEMS
jgi:hypothetical protein